MVQATEELCEDLVLVTDKHLLGQFLAGDDAAFTKIVERHAGMVRAVCHRVLRNPSDCDDAFQATFIILASRAKSLTWHDSIGGWLHQVARRVSVRLRADLARRRIAEQDSVADQSSEDTDPLHQVGVRELGEILDCELAKLPERFRDVILLTQAEGLSRSEAATRLGISVAAVKDRLERGRELLQSRLIKRGLTLSSATLAAWLVPNSANAASIPTLVANTGQMAVAFTSGKLIGTPLSVSATLAQGFLKTFGLHKATTVLALIVTLITGGSIAYGFLQDNPQRFNHGIRGQIVQLASGEKPAMTIELDEYQTLLDLDVSNNAKVWIAYEAATLDKLKVGQFVAVQLDQDHRTIKEIHAQGMIREATIRSVDESGKLVIEGDDDNADPQPESIELSPDTIVRIGGLPATRKDLLPGMEVPLEFSESGHMVHAIETDASEHTLVEGELITIDAQHHEFVLASEDESDQVVRRRFTIDGSSMLNSNGKPIRIEDLKVGCLLKIRLAADGFTVRALNADFPPADEEAAEPEER